MDAISEIESIQALGKVQFIPLDLSSLNSVKNFCTEFKSLGLQLDILISNLILTYLRIFINFWRV
jgi:NAD(P)-dependent dehydrogenase (short-subunit alcohol dehydrogenase family)